MREFVAKTFLMIAAICGIFAVIIGAFGAHGLKHRLTVELMGVYQTAVQYHFYHSLALLAVGMLLLQYPNASAFQWSGWLMFAGLIIFSGSLYVLALTGIKWMGAITPIGGVAFIAGWLALAIGVYLNINE
ncbi:MAG: uncharacterized membrane protein YgdD (TMEM256/DUF423 family) [Oceanicoccus sp.]